MPFEKGRKKTGGRQKGGPRQRANKFVDQLSNAGFNYVKELAETLKGLRDLRVTATDPKTNADAYLKATELKFFYNELKSLLPYMAPKLREKEVETIDEPETPPAQSAISDEDLLKAIGDGSEPENKVQPRSRPVLPPAPLEATKGTEERMVGEEPEID